jgi:prepilin-type N-terminal cleavage/methylation domain-containing protein
VPIDESKPCLAKGARMLESIRKRTADQQGMTLIELMVSLFVVAILMAITIPTAATYIARQELRGNAREVVEVLKDSREAAMNEAVPRFVLFDPAINSYRVCRFNTATNSWPVVTACPAVPLGNSVSFSDADVTFPALANHPVNGASVPENAAYFDTRGRYPFGSAASTYSITLRSRNGDTIILTLYTATGQVTGL